MGGSEKWPVGHISLTFAVHLALRTSLMVDSGIVKDG
jgi:hypothetical protein